LKLNVEEQKQLEAYRLYLKGRNAWNKRTREGMEQGIDYFQQAIAADPNYAAAYAGLAELFSLTCQIETLTYISLDRVEIMMKILWMA